MAHKSTGLVCAIKAMADPHHRHFVESPMRLRFWRSWRPCEALLNIEQEPCDRVALHGGDHRYTDSKGRHFWRVEPNGAVVASMR